MQSIDANFLYRIKVNLETGYLNDIEPTRPMLECLLELGFESARYWMISQDEVVGDTKLVLANSVGRRSLDDQLGYSIDATHCSILQDVPAGEFDRRRTRSKILKHTADELDKSSPKRKTNATLQLGDKYFVHIPVLCHGSLHGQLSCSFNSGYSELDPDYLNGLSALGMMLGDYKLLHMQSRVRDTISEFESQEDRLVRSRDKKAAQRLVTELIGKLLGASKTTLFDFNWYDADLVSVYESTNASEATSPTKATEIFSTDEHLTGKAFVDRTYRYVRSLDELQKTHPDLICKASLDAGLVSDGRIGGSVVYELVGSREHTSLVRVYNKADFPKVPFDYFEIDALEQACRYFSKAYDDIASFSQLDRLQRFSVKITDNIADIRKICSDVRELLSDDWVSGLVVFGRLAGEVNTTLYLSDEHGTRSLAQHPSDLMAACLDAKEVSWLSLESSNFDEEGALEQYLLNSGSTGLLVFPSDFANYSGGIGVPVLRFPASRSFKSSKHSLIPQMAESNILAYASILSRLIWFARNSIASDDAQKLVGQIGHEIKAPIRKIERLAVQIDEAIGNGIKKIPELSQLDYERFEIQPNGQHGYVRSKIGKTLRTDIRNLKDLVKYCNVTVDVASTFAQQSENSIDLTFSKVEIHELCLEIANELRRETEIWHGQRYVSCQFEFNPAFKRIKKLVCDRYLVGKIIENVFRNALKYSNPPGDYKPIVITVNANPQPDYLNIIVTNWGSAIPDDQSESIFQPFQRGTSVDRIHARRGLGIGLYIARIFARAHRGNVALVSSRPGFDDKYRRSAEGWTTTFEIRLSTRLKTGTEKFDVLSDTANKEH